MADREHGTNVMYCRGSCRCDLCTRAHAEYNRNWFRNKPKPPKIKKPKKIYEKDCEWCGVKFRCRDKTSFNRNRFCSNQCGYKGRVCKETFQSGELHPNWQGGISDQNTIERQRFVREMRTLILERDGYCCTWCGSSSNGLHVDHILSWADHPFMRFDTLNCRTLCVPCHYRLTYGKEMPQDLRFWGTRREKI